MYLYTPSMSYQDRRQLGRWVSVSDAPSYSPPITNGPMADECGSLAQQGIVLPHAWRALETALTRQRTDRQNPVALRDVIEPGNTVQIDDILRPCQAEIQHGH